MSSDHITAVFSPFGSGYIAETHGSGNLGYERKDKSAWSKWLTALLFGGATTRAVGA